MIAYYKPDINAAEDYYPFGWAMPGRTWEADRLYRYGFNGKEYDNEVKGKWNQQDYGMRIYDPRVGRFLSVDPITKSYPQLSPYQYASNSPILGVDLDGLEFLTSSNARIAIGLQYNPKLKKITSFTTYFRSENIPDALNTAIENQNTCVNCIGSSAAQVASFKLQIPEPSSASNAETTDVDLEEGSAMGPSSSGTKIPIIPKNKKEASAQERNKTFFTEGASPRIGKANLALAAIDVATSIVEKIGNENLKSIVNTAKSQAVNEAVETIGIIQKAIDNGNLDGHLDQTSLVGLANYLLYGNKIEKYQVVNGKGSYVEDVELTRIANRLWGEYVKPINEKRQREELKHASKQKVDNTGQGNRAGF